MPDAAITLEVLPAGYGDCLLLTCQLERGVWRMLVDTGPDECWPTLRERLARLEPDAHGNRVIDVFVVTHIDHDHIGGAALLLSDRSLNLRFGDIWFNAPPQKRTRGVAEGQSLAGILGAEDRALPWNLAFGGGPAVAEAAGFMEVSTAPGTPRITLLSPDRPRLDRLFRVWARELERMRRKEHDEVEPQRSPVRGGVTLDIDALAAARTPVDQAAPNGSSIALLVEHEGASMLLAGDAFPSVLESAVGALTTARGGTTPLQVDAFKLSHHGSKGNTTNALLAAVRAHHYIVSTNGAIFGHPDDETIARVVKVGAAPDTVWFNYGTTKTRLWAEQFGVAPGRTRLVVPEVAAAGVQVALPRASRAKPSVRR